MKGLPKNKERGETDATADLANGGGAPFFDVVEKVKSLKLKDLFSNDLVKENTGARFPSPRFFHLRSTKCD